MYTPEEMPSHWTPEYLAEYNGRPIIIVAVVYLILNTTFVVLRFISRRLQGTGLGWDDPLVVLSWLLNVGFFVSEIIHILQFKAGHHQEYFANRPDLLAGYGIIAFYVQTIIYCLAVVPPRLAILVLYLKIFTSKVLRKACYIVGILMTAVAVADIFALLFMCNPRAKAWQPDLPGHCIDLQALFSWGTFPNFVFDFCILLMPVPVLWRLQTKVHVKVGLFTTFMVGSLGLITAILRWSAYFTNEFVNNDATWNVNPLEIYIMTEISTYLMCACLLTFRTLFNRLASTEMLSSIHTWLLRSRSRTSTSDTTGRFAANAAKTVAGLKGRSTSPNGLSALSKHDRVALNRNSSDEDELENDIEMDCVRNDRIQVVHEFEVLSTARPNPSVSRQM